MQVNTQIMEKQVPSINLKAKALKSTSCLNAVDKITPIDSEHVKVVTTGLVVIL